MNRLNQNLRDAFITIGQFNTDHPLNPLVPRATTLFTELASVADSMDVNGSLQATGITGFRAGSQERRFAFATLVTEMRALNKIARGLDQDEFPGIREEFRMPQSHSFANILAQAGAFVTNATGKETVFTERGMPAAFLTAFTTLVNAAQASVHTRNTGRIKRSAATVGTTIKGRRGLKLVRELDGIISVALRNDPAQLAAWRTAKRVVRRAPAEEASAGAGTPPAPAPAPGA